MKKIGLLILIFGFSILDLFSQVPNGAKKTFHIKIEQENRFYVSNWLETTLIGDKSWSKILMTNGAMIELGFKHITFGATFLTDYDNSGGTDRIDLDLGYEFNITNSLNIQPFLGLEMNENGVGVSTGAKLNKSFDLFDFMSLGVFAGCRFCRTNDYGPYEYSAVVKSDYLSASIGAYALIYNYKRPKIIRNW